MRKVTLICIVVIVIVLGIIIAYICNSKIKSERIEEYIENLSLGDNHNISAEYNDEILGYITIPIINLEKIEVRDGTDLETLEEFVGHFKNTNIYNGNIGLASHNRGGIGDYFKDIDKLEIGNVIYYETKFGSKKYIVDNIEKIKSTDWSILESTEENRITLITCVKNDADLRLCVSAVEKD